MSTYALADTKVQWFADDFPGVRFEPNCGVLHTTETTGWPGYDGGAKAPNYTARPDLVAKKLVWRAHFPDEMSSRALRNLSGGVETNTLNAVQVELVGTCDPATRDRWIREGKVDFVFWPEAPEWALRDLAAFIADMHKRHGIKIQGPDGWMAYPASFGISNPNRFTFAQWRAFYGWCGHQHVPENSHGDPGALPWAKVAEYARELLNLPAQLQLTVLTANLGRGVTETELTTNVHRLRHSKAVKGFQEIDEADRPEEHAVLARELPPGWAAFDTRVPINVPPPWRIVRTRITRACDGLAHFTPHRLITQALIERLDPVGAEPPRLVIVNLHFPRRAPRTLTRRRQCRRALRKVIAYWHDLGYTVVWMGDTNQVRMRKMHDLEQSVVDAGLDHIRVVPHPEGVQVEVLRTGSVDLTIDGHDAHYARLRLTLPTTPEES